MGKGDKRTRRGKIFNGSFGKTRPKAKKNAAQNDKDTKTENKDNK
jgi:30S ribosomal protein S31